MDEVITEARKLVQEFSRFIEAQDLNSIHSSLCEDAHFEIQYVPDMNGKDAIGNFFEDRFSKGSFSFKVDITEEKAISDVVFINGEMEKVFTPASGYAENSTMHYSIILKKEDGHLKIWQCRFAM